MQIASFDFEHNHYVPQANTCGGANISPALQFIDIPKGTASLVLVVEDMDVRPEPWTHWLVFDIPPTTSFVGEGEVPSGGREGLANGGTHGYEGPCPQYFSGTHHYYFRLFALDEMLGLPSTATKSAVLAAMEDHVLEETALVALCEGELKHKKK